MGAYLDRLNAQFDEIRDGIDTLVNRAAEENRDVTDSEQEQVDRDRARLTELETAIARYSELEQSHGRVASLRQATPNTHGAVLLRSTTPQPDEYDIAREFPSVGDYAITLHRAMVLRDPEARAKIDRATEHQKLADNPGIVPRPILGPVLNYLNTGRPFINSIVTRPLPAGSFDRPEITQHVAVGKQAAEKDLTASQKMVIGKLPVTAQTYAGHLNISRQDVKWTNPGILSLVFEDFAGVYAQVTDNDAADQFVASVTGAAVPIDSWDNAIGAIFGGAATVMGAANRPPDTFWTSVDVWANMGGAVNSVNGYPIFPGMSPTAQGGTAGGIRVVVDPNFAAGTAILGPSSLVEWYEDVDGLMQVGEPDVLGQLVGFAGFGAFLNVKPDAFVKFTAPPVVPLSGSSSGSSESSGK